MSAESVGANTRELGPRIRPWLTLVNGTLAAPGMAVRISQAVMHRAPGRASSFLLQGAGVLYRPALDQALLGPDTPNPLEAP